MVLTGDESRAHNPRSKSRRSEQTAQAGAKACACQLTSGLPLNIQRKYTSDVEFFGESSPASAGVTVNYARVALASLVAMVAYFVYGFAMFAAWPSMKTEYMKYPNVYRPKDEMMKVMPYGMIAIFVAIVVVAVLYAKIHTAGGGIVSGIYLGALIGLFSVCTFAIHNYINLNIGLTLTIYQSIAYFIQWVIVGAAIGLIYKP
jgi:hypothetical protein